MRELSLPPSLCVCLYVFAVVVVVVVVVGVFVFHFLNCLSEMAMNCSRQFVYVCVFGKKVLVSECGFNLNINTDDDDDNSVNK